MNKYLTKIFAVCFGVIIALFILLFCYVQFSWVILPTNSIPNTLTLVSCGSASMKKITMKHYVNDELINAYMLELKVGVHNQTSQKYKLPEVNEGRVEFYVEIADGMVGKSIILTSHYKSEDVYKKGLLIYSDAIDDSTIEINGLVYKDQYADFISGKERITYFEKAGELQWSLITDAPKPKKFVREEMGYSPMYYGWKEANKWVKQTSPDES